MEKKSFKLNYKVNLSLTLSFYHYCIDPVYLIDRIVKSKLHSISIRSIHDIVPTIIKTKKYFSLLKHLNLIRCSSKSNILDQILEVNYILYQRYFPFHKKHIETGAKILRIYKNYQKIGIHVRLDDQCLNFCHVNITDVYRISNLSNKYCKNCIIMLSSFNNNFSRLLIKIYTIIVKLL